MRYSKNRTYPYYLDGPQLEYEEMQTLVFSGLCIALYLSPLEASWYAFLNEINVKCLLQWIVIKKKPPQNVC